MNFDGSWLKPLKALQDNLESYKDSIWRDLQTKRVYKIDGVVLITNIPYFSAIEVSSNKQCFLHADWMFPHFNERLLNYETPGKTANTEFNSTT